MSSLAEERQESPALASFQVHRNLPGASQLFFRSCSPSVSPRPCPKVRPPSRVSPLLATLTENTGGGVSCSSLPALFPALPNPFPRFPQTRSTIHNRTYHSLICPPHFQALRDTFHRPGGGTSGSPPLPRAWEPERWGARVRTSGEKICLTRN
jgi:hypothetical protein